MPESNQHSELDRAKSILAEYERTNTLWLMIRGDGYADDCAALLAGLIEQNESLRVALSFYAEQGGDGGALAKSILNGERPQDHVFRFFADLHGVSNPAISQDVSERGVALVGQQTDAPGRDQAPTRAGDLEASASRSETSDPASGGEE